VDLYLAGLQHKIDCIVLKAIADWANGRKVSRSLPLSEALPKIRTGT